MYPDPDLSEAEVRLTPGDTLLLDTDGVSEARSPDGLYGSARLEALLSSLADACADDIADVILAEVSDFQDGRFRDDVALLVAQARR